MRNTNTKRKGFTLVELLIVIAILGTLGATMMVASSGSTAKAKAATIATNVNACRSAAMLYVINNADEVDFSEKKAEDVLKAAIPTWVDFSDKEGKIKYAGTSDTGDSDKWAITVDFSEDPEKKTIRTELQKIKGYNKYATDSGNASVMGDNVYWFKVTLLSGKIEACTKPTTTEAGG